ncbi:VOC family protein [Asticcacaulis sp. YBE204]|uniref:VOC family protein n=1 Tax=Asticcacaulis sp. YBE204 TaxID=1282363 RepID=UPI0003C410E6|nr:VOC family protein [Asticcacaulis sp. YBE204]ESQ80226.1 hypothetical protein AEYBE204_06295 [Asticcacaulis sp. YBE204]
MTDAIILNVRDPQKSAAFYAGLLNIEAENDDGAVAFRFGGQRLRLCAGEGRAHEIGIRLRHEAAVISTYEHWWDKGVRLTQIPTRGVNGMDFWAEDPDGHRLHVFCA